jgi:hypothetical protein
MEPEQRHFQVAFFRQSVAPVQAYKREAGIFHLPYGRYVTDNPIPVA